MRLSPLVEQSGGGKLAPEERQLPLFPGALDKPEEGEDSLLEHGGRRDILERVLPRDRSAEPESTPSGGVKLDLFADLPEVEAAKIPVRRSVGTLVSREQHRTTLDLQGARTSLSFDLHSKEQPKPFSFAEVRAFAEAAFARGERVLMMRPNDDQKMDSVYVLASGAFEALAVAALANDLLTRLAQKNGKQISHGEKMELATLKSDQRGRFSLATITKALPDREFPLPQRSSNSSARLRPVS